MSCNIAAHKYLTGQIDGVAVVAPMGVHRQWIEEAIPECMTKAVPVRTAIWKPGADLRRIGMLGSPSSMRCLAFNVEAFSTSSGRAQKALMEYLRSGRILLILDESTSVKNPRAERTRTLLEIAPHAAARMILTGTPITKGIEDLWAQYEFLSPEIIGMSNYYAFRGRYCVTRKAFHRAPPGAVKIVGYRNMEEFVRKIAGVTFVIPKDVLGLEPKFYEQIPVELTDEQRSLYNAIRKKLVDDLAERRVVGPANAAVRLIRLQQVLCGRVLVREDDDPESPGEWKPVKSNRLKSTLQFIEDNPDTYVIWARFHADVEEIVAALKKMGRKPAAYYGPMSDEERAKAKKLFIAEKADTFVASPAIASQGLDGLQKVCNRSIWYSRSFSRLHRWQGEDRLWRMGQSEGVGVFDVMAGKNTTDHMELETFAKTEDLIKDFMSNPAMLPEV